MFLPLKVKKWCQMIICSCCFICGKSHPWTLLCVIQSRVRCNTSAIFWVFITWCAHIHPHLSHSMPCEFASFLLSNALSDWPWHCLYTYILAYPWLKASTCAANTSASRIFLFFVFMVALHFNPHKAFKMQHRLIGNSVYIFVKHRNKSFKP